MPRFRPYTEAQRKAQREKQEKEAYEAWKKRISDSLALYKHNNRLTNEQLGSLLGLDRVTTAKMLNGQDIKVSTEKFYKTLKLTGVIS